MGTGALSAESKVGPLTYGKLAPELWVRASDPKQTLGSMAKAWYR